MMGIKLKPWTIACAVAGLVIFVAGLSKHMLKEGSGRGENPMVLRAATFLERSEKSNSTLGSLLHAARGRVIAASVSPATPRAVDILEKCTLRERMCLAVMKRKMQKRVATGTHLDGE